MNDRITGYVQSYNRARGYGFLIPYGSTFTIYVEADALEPPCTTLSEGQQITFTIAFTEGRYTAHHVRN
ncbi:cold shock domain-containing protein [Streptomyces sp. H27-H1]|uniref:cold shock domain-containing protein n=1 Tax=Streptomyces sp. H27-H1 TaxID=2996461 RepID=UPI00226E2B8B|nr:cold shock domain-containing protein [Streptomyces sp. H27-H1]MCY0929072.1 cold shock domain-containing protein [Streptomyces sp. H27-H1]